MGKASFVHIQDMSGQIQLYVTRDLLPENFYNEQFKNGILAILLVRKACYLEPKQ